MLTVLIVIKVSPLRLRLISLAPTSLRSSPSPDLQNCRPLVLSMVSGFQAWKPSPRSEETSSAIQSAPWRTVRVKKGIQDGELSC
jgi:hypothetical protein